MYLKSKVLLLIQCLVLFAISPVVLFFLVPLADTDASSLYRSEKIEQISEVGTVDKKIKEVIGLPARLKIPKIEVDAVFEHVGLTVAGVMAAPKSPANVAWLSAGPRPGERGSVVVNGHFGWRDGIPAVFDDLHKLAVGDKIYVVDNTGATTTFVVHSLKTYGEGEEAFGVFNSIDGKAHLNLITCQGKWNAVEQRYSDRLVVFADREEI